MKRHGSQAEYYLYVEEGETRPDLQKRVRSGPVGPGGVP